MVFPCFLTIFPLCCCFLMTPRTLNSMVYINILGLDKLFKSGSGFRLLLKNIKGPSLATSNKGALENDQTMSETPKFIFIKCYLYKKKCTSIYWNFKYRGPYTKFNMLTIKTAEPKFFFVLRASTFQIALAN